MNSEVHSPQHLQQEWQLAPLLADAPQVAESPPLADETFRSLYRRVHRPVVLRGLGASWRHGREWTLPRLRQRLGQRVVPAVEVVDRVMSYDENHGAKWVMRRFDELADSLQHAAVPEWYLMLHLHEVAEVAGDVETPEYCRRATWIFRRMTVVGTGCITPLHFETSSSLFCLCSGEKEFLLFPPTDWRNVYGRSPFSGQAHMSRLDMGAPDATRFPRLAQARPWRCRLRGGDVLFIPRLWWHATYTHAPAVGLGTWWAEGVWGLFPRAIQLYQRLRDLHT